MKAEWLPYLQTMALEKGWMEGQMDYRRFIILGRSRVGSNLLRGSLNAHSAVRVFGELFQNRDGIGWAMPGYREDARTKALFLLDPVRFLEEKVFHPYPPDVRAVGFKLFYYHARAGAWSGLWPYLQTQRDLRVLHIKRRNILKTHLSRKRAAQTDVWVDLSGSRKESSPITLDYVECLQDFEQTRAWEAEADRTFAEHQRLDVIYEELASDYDCQMARIQGFLGVDLEAVAPETHKQAKQPLSAAIANYHELKERFTGSPWESFFVD